MKVGKALTDSDEEGNVIVELDKEYAEMLLMKGWEQHQKELEEDSDNPEYTNYE